MKKVLIILSFLGFALLATQTASAQVDDTLPPWFRGPLVVQGPMDLSGVFVIPHGNMQLVKAMPNTTLKMLELPQSAAPRTKVVNGPITLQKGSTCVQVGCAKGSCATCNMVWWDRNRDGKLQPKKELRCVCPNNRQKCKVTAKQVSCR